MFVLIRFGCFQVESSRRVSECTQFHLISYNFYLHLCVSHASQGISSRCNAVSEGVHFILPFPSHFTLILFIYFLLAHVITILKGKEVIQNPSCFYDRFKYHFFAEILLKIEKYLLASFANEVFPIIIWGQQDAGAFIFSRKILMLSLHVFFFHLSSMFHSDILIL